jgi:hypothetical protein
MTLLDMQGMQIEGGGGHDDEDSDLSVLLCGDDSGVSVTLCG